MTSILHSHPSSPAIAQQHLNNMSASLAHRIEIARANNDQQLLTQLQYEQKQLESLQSPRSFSGTSSYLNRFRRFWKQVVVAIQNADKLHVEKHEDVSGEVWWYAHDPRSNKTLWANSEAEIVKWIEDNNLGR